MRTFAMLAVIGTIVFSTACGAAPAAPAPAAQPAKPATAAQPAAAQPAQPAPPAAAPAQSAAQPTQGAVKPQPDARPAAGVKPGEKIRMLYGASSATSSWYIHAAAMSKMWNASVPEIEVTPTENGGCLDTLRRMAAGEMQSGIYCSDLGYPAWHGIDDFKDKPIQVQRILFSHTVNPQAWLVRREANITKLEDLNGKEFTAGAKGTATEKQSMAILDMFGVKPRYVQAGLQDMMQSIRDKRSLGGVKGQVGMSIDAATQELNLATPLDIIGFTAEQEKKVLEKLPYLNFVTVEKDRLARDFPSRTVRVPAIVVSVIVTKDIPEEVAYKLTKAAIEDNMPSGQGLQAAAFTQMKGVDFAQFTVDWPVTPLHKGAVRYFKEIRKELKPSMLPPDM
ncbi:MAG: TAXI family TRAP transporter solute-binding subunit [Chloroflexi bacterium]|nr:TAXI family TRAP transporter solute-binding subunit [Chloroflexota bacterium]